MKEGRYIHVRVKTKAKTEKVNKKGEKFYIEVKEKAERNEANARVKQLLTTELGCTSRELRLIKGATTPSKTYLQVNS